MECIVHPILFKVKGGDEGSQHLSICDMIHLSDVQCAYLSNSITNDNFTHSHIFESKDLNN